MLMILAIVCKEIETICKKILMVIHLEDEIFISNINNLNIIKLKKYIKY
jgi:hypothetical protein